MVLLTQAVFPHWTWGSLPAPYTPSYTEQLLQPGVPGTTENRETKLGCDSQEFSIQSSLFPLGFYQETGV